MTSIHRNHTMKTHQAVEERAKHTQINSEGQMVSPNGTGQVITDDTKTHDGHINGMEFKYQKEFSEKNNLSQEEHDNIFEKASFYQKEPADENFSHKFEEKDHNEGMQNVTMAAFGEDRSVGQNIFITQNEDRSAGTIDYINPETGEVMNISEYTLPSELTMSSHNEEDGVSYSPTAISEPDSSSNTQSWFQASEDNDESEEHLTDNDSDGYYDFDSDSDSESL